MGPLHKDLFSMMGKPVDNAECKLQASTLHRNQNSMFNTAG